MMPDSPQTRREYVRRQRRQLATWGVFVPFFCGALTFCLVVPTLAILNLIVPHLPWIPSNRPVEPPVMTAWLCARFATVCMFLVEAALYIFAPYILERRSRKR
jgi:hypothetical protein